MTKLKENLVVKSNELIQASYAMTVNEQRLLLACISQIDSRKQLDKDGTFTLTIEQARDLFYSKGDQRNAYRDLQDASERLFERKVRIALPNNQELLTRFVQSITFIPDSGSVEIRFAYEIMPYLSQLEQNFTKYRLQNVVQLTSSYAIRIYELLVSWAGQNQMYKELEISKFRELLSLNGKYKQFGQLNQFVINPAVEQINESTDFNLEISFKKYRRAYHWIQLGFKRKVDIGRAEEQKQSKRLFQSEHNEKEKKRRLRKEAEITKKEETKNALKNWSLIKDGTQYLDSKGKTWTKDGYFLTSLEIDRITGLKKSVNMHYLIALELIEALKLSEVLELQSGDF